jgi:hypothetical protein
VNPDETATLAPPGDARSNFSASRYMNATKEDTASEASRDDFVIESLSAWPLTKV